MREREKEEKKDFLYLRHSTDRSMVRDARQQAIANEEVFLFVSAVS